MSGTGLPMYGTNVLTGILNEAGGLPTRNFSAGSFEFADAIGGETQRATILERGGNVSHGCSTGWLSSARATGWTRTATTRPRVPG